MRGIRPTDRYFYTSLPVRKRLRISSDPPNAPFLGRRNCSLVGVHGRILFSARRFTTDEQGIGAKGGLGFRGAADTAPRKGPRRKLAIQYGVQYGLQSSKTRPVCGAADAR